MLADGIWCGLLGMSLGLNIFLLLRSGIQRWAAQRKKEGLTHEIMAMVEEGEESGAIEHCERELIQHIFDFNTMTARDVMIHRTDMVAFSLDQNQEEMLELIRVSGLSRFPVYQEKLDNIVGILSVREYLFNLQEEHPRALEDLLWPAYFVPESVRADVLFRDMQHRKLHMALVVDEYGGVEGVLTLEDLLEELVGKIYDEFDPQEKQDIVQISSHQWGVTGAAELEELSEAMGMELIRPEGIDCDTVGGLVFALLPVIPEDGSRPMVEVMGLRIQVEWLRDRRIQWAVVEPSVAQEEEETEGEIFKQESSCEVAPVSC